MHRMHKIGVADSTASMMVMIRVLVQMRETGLVCAPRAKYDEVK